MRWAGLVLFPASVISGVRLLGGSGRNRSPRTVGLGRGTREQQMYHQPGAPGTAATTDHQAELLAPGQPGGRGKHGPRSGGQTAATPAPARGNDRAARARTHAQPEPVLAGTSTVVRLEGALALAHGGSPRYFRPVVDRLVLGPDGSVKMSPPAVAVAMSAAPLPRREESARGDRFSRTPRSVPCAKIKRGDIPARAAGDCTRLRGRTRPSVTGGIHRRQAAGSPPCEAFMTLLRCPSCDARPRCGSRGSVLATWTAGTGGAPGGRPKSPAVPSCTVVDNSVDTCPGRPAEPVHHHPALAKPPWPRCGSHGAGNVPARGGERCGVRPSIRAWSGLGRSGARAVVGHALAATTRLDAGDPADRPAGRHGAIGGSQ